MALREQTWEALFANFELPKDTDQPIKEREFNDPQGKTIKAIFYLYSLETFLYRRLNWAARSKAAECVDNLGCFAAILSKALAACNKYRAGQEERAMSREFVVYRGLSLADKDLAEYEQMRDRVINL